MGGLLSLVESISSRLSDNSDNTASGWLTDRFVGPAIWLWLSPALRVHTDTVFKVSPLGRPSAGLSCDLPLDGLSNCQLFAERETLSLSQHSGLQTSENPNTTLYSGLFGSG